MTPTPDITILVKSMGGQDIIEITALHDIVPVLYIYIYDHAEGNYVLHRSIDDGVTLEACYKEDGDKIMWDDPVVNTGATALRGAVRALSPQLHMLNTSSSALRQFTTDGGKTWVTWDNLDHTVKDATTLSKTYWAQSFIGDNGSLLTYSSSGDRFLISKDGGLNYEANGADDSCGFPDTPYFTDFHYMGNGEILVWFPQTSGTETYYELYRSTDNGVSWSLWSTTPSWNDSAIDGGNFFEAEKVPYKGGDVVYWAYDFTDVSTVPENKVTYLYSKDLQYQLKASTPYNGSWTWQTGFNGSTLIASASPDLSPVTSTKEYHGILKYNIDTNQWTEQSNWGDWPILQDKTANVINTPMDILPYGPEHSAKVRWGLFG
jgi:hypothetical protein